MLPCRRTAGARPFAVNAVGAAVVSHAEAVATATAAGASVRLDSTARERTARCGLPGGLLSSGKEINMLSNSHFFNLFQSALV